MKKEYIERRAAVDKSIKNVLSALEGLDIPSKEIVLRNVLTYVLALKKGTPVEKEDKRQLKLLR